MSLNIGLLRSSFDAVSPKGNDITARFYEILFERYPSVVPLFAHTEPAKQQQKLLASLAIIVKSVDNPDTLGPYLKSMGKRHVGYGTLPEHYDAVGECLLAAMSETAGDAWTPEINQVWTEAYGIVKGIMLEGATA